MKRVTLALTASCLFLQGCLLRHEENPAPPPFDWPLPQLSEKVSTFSSCEDLKNWYQERQNAWQRANSIYRYSGDVVPLSAVAMASPGASAPSSVTNVQVPGIDEPDLVKTFAGRIFYARAHTVEVLSARDLSPVTTLEYRDLTNLQLLQFANRLAVIGSQNDEVRVHIVKESGGHLSEEKSFTFRGSLLAARQQANDLTLVMRSSLSDTPPEIPCAQIARPFLSNSFETGLTAVHTINFAGEDIVADSMATIGRADQVYMSERNLYLFRTGYTWFGWDSRLVNDTLYNGSIVAKLELRQGRAPRLLAAAAVQGQTRNNLAFSENKTGRYLFIATTTGWPQKNRLWVLGNDKNQQESPFKLVAQSAEFGVNEDIRAVRFIDDRAYVVTFEKTDPLFVFDLSRPESPRLLSQLEMPGFSAYLHALAPDQLFGAGYAAVPETNFSWLGGIQLSLFHLNEDGTVEVTEQKQFGGRGSHVDAAHDYHAFTLDARTGLIALPVRILGFDPKADPWTYSTRLEFSGALMLNPAEGLEPVGQLTHTEWIPTACLEQLTNPTWWNAKQDSLDVQRVIAIENGLVSLSPFGVKLHQAEPPFATRAEQSFDRAEEQCQPIWRGRPI